MVSNVGQLFQAQSLIEQYDIRPNLLAVIWTAKNKVVLRNIINNANSSAFDKIELVQLPINPNSYNKKRLLKIYSIYEELFQKFNIESVFICNYNSHYNFINQIARKKNIAVNLFEEGAGTYKNKLLLENRVSDPFKQRLKLALKSSVSELRKTLAKSIYYKLFQFIVDVITNHFEIVKSIVKSFIRIGLSFFSDKQRERIIQYMSPPEIRSFHNIITTFDNAYLAFPDKGKEIFKATNYYEITSDYTLNEEAQEILQSNELLSQIDRESVIFIDQCYNVNLDEHAKTIVNFLGEYFPDQKVFIKFHPRNKGKVRSYYSKYLDQYNNIILLNLELEVPVEAILMEKKPKLIVSVASSALLYTKKITKETNVLCCADIYLKMMQGSISNPKVIDEIIADRNTIRMLSDDIKII